ncbi:MAG: undecaprenyl-diphosphate phosphatase [Candidatus Colwellbacteria bacterium]|nr:undecaprenyl-diphosphate phosphatase [Candidatus Colwellbacteria bacterium]
MLPFQAALLGLIQGATEFLPISSSGHLVIFQKLLNIQGDTLSFDVFVHLGTLIAVILIFKDDIFTIFKKPFGKLPILLVIGTIPAIIIGFFFSDTIERLFSSGSTLGFEFFLTGIILLYAESLSRRTQQSASLPKNLSTMTSVDAITIGMAQAVAILPAVSRSGLTLAGALSRKLDREFALKYSFLLSIPAILGSALLDGVKIFKGAPCASVSSVIIGMTAAAISGYFAIRFMLKIFTKKSLTPFAIYVFVIGGLVIIDQFVTHIFF